MAQWRSIRLDFPAEGVSISDEAMAQVLRQALAEYAARIADAGRAQAAGRLAQAVDGAVVYRYDDRAGHPVFYIA